MHDFRKGKNIEDLNQFYKELKELEENTEIRNRSGRIIKERIVSLTTKMGHLPISETQMERLIKSLKNGLASL